MAEGRASEIRRRILAQHDELRGMLDEVQVLTERFESGDPEVGKTLRERGLALYERFAEHLDLEDRILEPALRAASPAGPMRADQLTREHHEQRELLRYLLGRLSRQQLPTLLVARELRNFVDYVRVDMEQEEETLLSEVALRDDALTPEG